MKKNFVKAAIGLLLVGALTFMSCSSSSDDDDKSSNLNAGGSITISNYEGKYTDEELEGKLYGALGFYEKVYLDAPVRIGRSVYIDYVVKGGARAASGDSGNRVPQTLTIGPNGNITLYRTIDSIGHFYLGTMGTVTGAVWENRPDQVEKVNMFADEGARITALGHGIQRPGSSLGVEMTFNNGGWITTGVVGGATINAGTLNALEANTTTIIITGKSQVVLPRYGALGAGGDPGFGVTPTGVAGAVGERYFNWDVQGSNAELTFTTIGTSAGVQNTLDQDLVGNVSVGQGGTVIFNAIGVPDPTGLAINGRIWGMIDVKKDGKVIFQGNIDPRAIVTLGADSTVVPVPQLAYPPESSFSGAYTPSAAQPYLFLRVENGGTAEIRGDIKSAILTAGSFGGVPAGQFFVAPGGKLTISGDIANDGVAGAIGVSFIPDAVSPGFATRNFFVGGELEVTGNISGTFDPGIDIGDGGKASFKGSLLPAAAGVINVRKNAELIIGGSYSTTVTGAMAGVGAAIMLDDYAKMSVGGTFNIDHVDGVVLGRGATLDLAKAAVITNGGINIGPGATVNAAEDFTSALVISVDKQNDGVGGLYVKGLLTATAGIGVLYNGYLEAAGAFDLSDPANVGDYATVKIGALSPITSAAVWTVGNNSTVEVLGALSAPGNGNIIGLGSTVTLTVTTTGINAMNTFEVNSGSTLNVNAFSNTAGTRGSMANVGVYDIKSNAKVNLNGNITTLDALTDIGSGGLLTVNGDVATVTPPTLLSGGGSVIINGNVADLGALLNNAVGSNYIVNGTVTAGRLDGGFSGNLTVNGDYTTLAPAGNFKGNVVINGNVPTFTATNNVGATGNLTVNGNVTSAAVITLATAGGNITINGKLTTTGVATATQIVGKPGSNFYVAETTVATRVLAPNNGFNTVGRVLFAAGASTIDTTTAGETLTFIGQPVWSTTSTTIGAGVPTNKIILNAETFSTMTATGIASTFDGDIIVPATAQNIAIANLAELTTQTGRIIINGVSSETNANQIVLLRGTVAAPTLSVGSAPNALLALDAGATFTQVAGALTVELNGGATTQGNITLTGVPVTAILVTKGSTLTVGHTIAGVVSGESLAGSFSRLVLNTGGVINGAGNAFFDASNNPLPAPAPVGTYQWSNAVNGWKVYDGE